MITYQLSGEGVLYKDDVTGEVRYIPPDPTNPDWQAYQQWLGEGNTPDPEYSLDQRKEMRKSDLQNIFSTYLEGNIFYNEVIYSSAEEERNYLNTILMAAERTELTFPMNWNDINMVPQSVSLINLQAIQKGEALLIKACVDNYGDLYGQVEASADPESVNISVGWPTIPYVVV